MVRKVNSIILVVLFIVGSGSVAAAGSQEPETVNSDLQQRTELEILGDVRGRLTRHPEIDATDIDVEIDQRTVTLNGTVAQYSDISLAEKITDKVTGVVEVNNYLEAKPLDNTLAGEELEERVNNLIDRDPVLSTYNLDVTVNDRNVILEGDVDSVWVRQYLEDEVSTLDGIVDIENRVTVVPTEDLTDEQIAEDIMESIEIDPSVDAENVTLTVNDNKVTLEGEVTTFEARQDVKEIAQTTAGVVEVNNKLTVTSVFEEDAGLTISPEDSTIKADVRSQLLNDVLVEEGEIDVTVEDGVVTLSGVVDSSLEEEAAIDDAWSVYGVENVVDQILISGADIGVDTLREDVRQALTNRTTISPLDLTVNVDMGEVTLKGTVTSVWQKYDATDVADSVIGVTKVNNLLTVVPENEVEDEIIAKDVVESLRDNKTLDPEDITVRVDDGKVTLTGFVESHDAKQAAAAAARDVTGVISVDNNLTVA